MTSHHRLLSLAALLTALLALSGCGGRSGEATRTPVPTWTPTPLGAVVAQAPAQDPAAQQPTPLPIPPTLPPTATSTNTPIPSPTPTPLPTDTPTPVPTPTETPLPTDTPTPVPTPTPAYLFDLETAERFVTESLAQDIVRAYLYAYDPAQLGLPGYSMQVLHNGEVLPVDDVTSAGLPAQTRDMPGPYTRFFNLSAVFVGPQAGEWVVQLVDANGAPQGPPATFTLTPDDLQRELYVRYR
ncbi:MAG: hypothetical protein KDE20_11075, partial [Caldilineaceae bacterium]|nr:hypothetical protein [Caldilineaceae bacterium]